MKQMVIILALALLTVSVTAQPRGAGRMMMSDSSIEMPMMQRGKMMLVPAELEQLGLRPDQQEKLKQHAFEVRRKRAEIIKETQLAQIDLEEAISKWPIDKKKMEKAGNTLSEKRKELNQLHLSTLTFLVSMLDQNQHAKLMDLQKNKAAFKGNNRGNRSNRGRGEKGARDGTGGMGRGTGPLM